MACGQEALTRDWLGVGSMVYGVRYRTVYGVRTFAVFSTCLIMERKKEAIICAHVELSMISVGKKVRVYLFHHG